MRLDYSKHTCISPERYTAHTCIQTTDVDVYIECVQKKEGGASPYFTPPQLPQHHIQQKM